MPALVKFNLHWSGVGEEGQVGVYCTPGGVSSLAQLENAVNGARDIIAGASYKAVLTDMLSADQKFDKVTGYLYATDANGAADYGAEASFSGGGIVGTGVTSNPLQISLAVTLLTGHSGASYRGRIYLPGQGLPFGAHQFQQAKLQPIANAIAGTGTADGLLWDFARSCDAAGSGGSDPVVYSRKLRLATPITSVKLDSRPDTQRRRAQSEPPLYVVSAPYVAFTG